MRKVLKIANIQKLSNMRSFNTMDTLELGQVMKTVRWVKKGTRYRLKGVN